MLYSLSALSINYTVCIVFLIILSTLGPYFLLKHPPHVKRWQMIPVAALLLLAFIARLKAPPAFIHSYLQGYTLLDYFADFPKPIDYRSGFGQCSFLVLGLFSRILKDPWDSVVVADCLFNTGILACAAVLAFRMGGVVAACAAVALGIFWPPIVRVAPTEDAHNVAVLMGMLALVFADGTRRSGKFGPVQALFIFMASFLSLFSRQTMFFIPLLSLSLVLPIYPWRGHKNAFLSLIIAMAASYLLYYFNMKQSGGTVEVRIILSVLSNTQPADMLRHPLSNMHESLALCVVFTAGCLYGLMKGEFTAAALICASMVTAVSTIAMVVDQNNNQSLYAYRLPLWALMLPVSGLGVSAVAGLFRTRRWGASPQYVVAAVLIAAGALWPIRAYLSYLSEKNPQDQEYRLVYDNSGKLPAGSVRLPRKTGCPHNIRFTPPNSAFKLGKGKQEFLSSDEKETVYVYSGLNCYAYPLLCHTKFSLNELGDALGKGIFNGPPELVLSKLNLDIPQGLTEACENVARRASRFIHWGDVSVEKQELPFIYYTKTTIPVGVWEIPPTTE